MIYKKFTYLVILIVFTTLQSCLDQAQQISNWLEATDIETIDGKYHTLSDDAIKIYLPSIFKRYNSVNYERVLDSLSTDKNTLKLEYARLNQLRQIDGNFHVFYDSETASTYTINTLPYSPMQKQDAKYILGMITAANDKNAYALDIEYTKITAKYNASAGPQIFKAIHKIEDTKSKLACFNATYIVSYNKKTVYIQLTTPFKANFDTFLQKMIL